MVKSITLTEKNTNINWTKRVFRNSIIDHSKQAKIDLWFFVWNKQNKLVNLFRMLNFISRKSGNKMCLLNIQINLLFKM